jgi:hypothetical protein
MLQRSRPQLLGEYLDMLPVSERQDRYTETGIALRHPAPPSPIAPPAGWWHEQRPHAGPVHVLMREGRPVDEWVRI